VGGSAVSLDLTSCPHDAGFAGFYWRQGWSQSAIMWAIRLRLCCRSWMSSSWSGLRQAAIKSAPCGANANQPSFQNSYVGSNHRARG